MVLGFQGSGVSGLEGLGFRAIGGFLIWQPGSYHCLGCPYS